jgi:hypothetical protein
MDISTNALISSGGTLAAIAVSWGVVKSKLVEYKIEIDKLVEWKDKHAELDINRLRDIEKNMAELRGMLSVSAEQYKEILRRLTIIEVKMEERRSIFKEINE